MAIAAGQTVSQGAVKATVLPQFSSRHPSQTNDVNILVQLAAAPSITRERPPLDLAIVLDRSGSMRGQKLTDSKLAAIKLIDGLRASDRVTLISYSSSVSRSEAFVMNKVGKEQVKRLVNAISAGGSTALGPALFSAFDTLGEAGNESRVRHVILMSDGIANVGEMNPSVIGQRAADAFRRGISVSTMGVGLDYNEDLMTQVADQGGGRYHFIENSQNIASILADELNGVAGTVARNVRLVFAGQTGVQLIKAFGYPMVDRGRESSIRIGFMTGRQNREVMLRLKLPKGLVGDAKPGHFLLGGLRLEYDDLNADGLHVQLKETITVGHASSRDAALKTENPLVSIRLSELEAAKKLKIAAAMTEAGNFEGAQKTITQALRSVSHQKSLSPSPRLNNQMEELENAMLDLGQARKSRSAQKRYSKKYKSRAYKSSKR
ncbi:MAG: VWA domain-containing protein [Myxococcota bacterium]|nr:VWA domain-containing protein [Myxococcota bacterium]